MTNQADNLSQTDRSIRRRPWPLIIGAVVVLVPAAFGFINKLSEFFATLRSDEGSFTIVPILTYLAVAAGFLCLLMWATMNGMFHDIEQPKYDMLENEKKLDCVNGAGGR